MEQIPQQFEAEQGLIEDELPQVITTKHTYITELLVNIIRLESVKQYHEIGINKDNWHGPGSVVDIEDVDYMRHDGVGTDYESDHTRSEESSDEVLEEALLPSEVAIFPEDYMTCTAPMPVSPLPALWLRTVIFIKKVTIPGQDLFVRGGLSSPHRSADDSNNNMRKDGAISIEYESLGTSPHYNKYNSWRKGVTKFDWYGRDEGQGSFEGMPAIGAPGAWTSNKTDVVEFQPLNTFGEHYWMLDVIMDITQTYNGWFELRSFLTNGDGWESDIHQVSTCTGTAGGVTPYSCPNHIGRCGYLNVFEFNSPKCQIDEF